MFDERYYDHPPLLEAFISGKKNFAGVLNPIGLESKSACGFFLEVVLPGLTGQAVQDANNFVKIGYHIRLGLAQRRHAQPRISEVEMNDIPLRPLLSIS